MKYISTKIMIAICAIALVSGIAIAATAPYIFHLSNPVTVMVNPSPSPSPTPTDISTLLTASLDTITNGNSVTLTATLSPVVSGITVNFYAGTSATGTPVGSAVTNEAGVASITISPTSTQTYVAMPQQ